MSNMDMFKILRSRKSSEGVKNTGETAQRRIVRLFGKGLLDRVGKNRGIKYSSKK